MTTSPLPDPAEANGNPDLIRIIREEISARGGRITFARFMELATAHPVHGYYRTAVRRPGRGGDFLTAPETTPWFGFVLARQIAECFERLGPSDRLTIREYGPGVGGLAWDIVAALLDHLPGLRPRLDYRLVEPNPHRRDQAMAAMREGGLGDVVSVEEIPDGEDPEPITGVVLANEVADALPVHRLVMRGGELREGWVTTDGETFIEIIDDLSDPSLGAPVLTWLQEQGVTLREGDRFEWSPAAAEWFRGAARGLGRGYALVIDYGYLTPELYRGHRLGGTLRTYSAHVAGDDPFVRVGTQDLTAHVDFSALIRAGVAEGLALAGIASQADVLERLGLGQVLLDAQETPGLSAAEYFALRAAIFRLIDPGGMGRFSVLAMARDAPVDPPLIGFAPSATLAPNDRTTP